MKCSNCGKNAQYEVSWMCSEDYKEHKFYLCDDCIKIPKRTPHLGDCDICGNAVSFQKGDKLFQIAFTDLKENRLLVVRDTCERCFVDIYINLHDKYLDRFVDNVKESFKMNRTREDFEKMGKKELKRLIGGKLKGDEYNTALLVYMERKLNQKRA